MASRVSLKLFLCLKNQVHRVRLNFILDRILKAVLEPQCFALVSILQPFLLESAPKSSFFDFARLVDSQLEIRHLIALQSFFLISRFLTTTLKSFVRTCYILMTTQRPSLQSRCTWITTLRPLVQNIRI